VQHTVQARPSHQPLSRRERGLKPRANSHRETGLTHLRAPHRGARFDPHRLPSALTYYLHELGALQGSGVWRKALCCFHEDHRPSLSVNVETGRFRCFACDAHGDLLDFHMRKHGLDFRSACKALGAWNG
jgi:hypothetical protein